MLNRIKLLPRYSNQLELNLADLSNLTQFEVNIIAPHSVLLGLLLQTNSSKNQNAFFQCYEINKKSAIAKNSSVSRVPTKIDFYTMDFKTGLS